MQKAMTHAMAASATFSLNSLMSKISRYALLDRNIAAPPVPASLTRKYSEVRQAKILASGQRRLANLRCKESKPEFVPDHFRVELHAGGEFFHRRV